MALSDVYKWLVDTLAPGLPDWPFCGQISEIWPYFKLVGRTIFELAVSLFLAVI